jgi:threonine aldolase
MNTEIRRGFASDNNAGVHPEILQSIQDANRGHAVAYGDDDYTRSAEKTFRLHFGRRAEVFFVFLGTGAYVLGLQAMTRSHHAVICADSAHIQVDECGAPEKFTGCKLLAVDGQHGKITPEPIAAQLHAIGFPHHAQPRVVSITQATEMGTVYTPEEIREITAFAHRHDLLVHMDGARLCNAAAALGVDLSAVSTEVGVDVLSFGGTKNGMMYGEALVFLRPDLARGFEYVRKQGMQLASKMRFIAAQFDALLCNDLWLRNARHANRMAALLAGVVREIPGVRITRPVESNAVFARLPTEWITALQREYFFYVWDEQTSEVRWMTSFDTSEMEIEDFADHLRRLAG